jgi:hypothetical protein
VGMRIDGAATTWIGNKINAIMPKVRKTFFTSSSRKNNPGFLSNIMKNHSRCNRARVLIINTQPIIGCVF